MKNKLNIVFCLIFFGIGAKYLFNFLWLKAPASIFNQSYTEMLYYALIALTFVVYLLAFYLVLKTSPRIQPSIKLLLSAALVIANLVLLFISGFMPNNGLRNRCGTPKLTTIQKCYAFASPGFQDSPFEEVAYGSLEPNICTDLEEENKSPCPDFISTSRYTCFKGDYKKTTWTLIANKEGCAHGLVYTTRSSEHMPQKQKEKIEHFLKESL